MIGAVREMKVGDFCLNELPYEKTSNANHRFILGEDINFEGMAQ
jgi:hypothetical protein